jgi:pyruvate-formate lyase-activating enzyme
MEKLKNFCALPFTQFTVSSFNEYQLCCDNLGESKMFSDKYSILEYFNSDYINDKRTSFLNGRKPDICKACWDREDKGLTSRRIVSLKNVKYNEQIERFKKGLPLVPNHPVFKIKFGNLCNLKCIMCGPQSSSTWAHHKEKYNEGQWPIYENTFNEKTYDDLKQILPNVERIIISGGEPLMSDRYYDFLEWLIGHKFAKKLKITTLTNASKIPEHLFQYKKAFKQLTFNISIDGIGKKDEYIRTGTVWQKKKENIKKLMRSYNIGFEITVQTLNVGYLDQIQGYLKDHYKKQSPLSNILVTPEYFSVDCLPSDLKKYYLNKNTKYITKPIINLLRVPTFGKLNPVKNRKFKKGLNFLKLCDERNNTNFLDEWPEFKKYV